MATRRYQAEECFWLFCYRQLLAELDGVVAPRQGPPPVALELGTRLRELSASVEWTMLPAHERALACVQGLLDQGRDDSFTSARDSASVCSQEPDGRRPGSVSWDPPLPLLGAGGQDEAWGQQRSDPAASLSPTSLQRVRGHRSPHKPAALHAPAEHLLFVYQPVLLVHGPAKHTARHTRGRPREPCVLLVRSPGGEPDPNRSPGTTTSCPREKAGPRALD